MSVWWFRRTGHVNMAIVIAVGLFIVWTSIANVSCAVQSVPTRPVTMLDLTVPKTALPTGCGLAPAPSVVDGNRVTGGFWAGLPISTAPAWPPRAIATHGLRFRQGS